MDGVLSQEEINALLNNNDAADSSDEILTESEKEEGYRAIFPEFIRYAME